ncbi:MAG: hypothetical protein M3Z24_14360, partial [Chloroflexota bacterium]|nr:hypothetical protein [Chloroflexota bacterium]
TPSCTTTLTTDRQPGEEATAVNVAVSERCTALAYNSAALQATATYLLTMKAQQQLGTHYSLIGRVQVTMLQTAVTNQRREMASIIISINGTWVYRFSPSELQQIKQRIAGKTLQHTKDFLLNMPGIARTTFDGIKENQYLPEDSTRIHITILYTAFNL